MERSFLNSESLNEYRLIIEVAGHVQEKIVQEKQYYQQNFHEGFTVGSKSSITLLSFMQYTPSEKKILPMIAKVLAEQSSFQLELSGYGFLPTHTIYVKISNRSRMESLIKKLKVVGAVLKADPDHKPHFINTPHLALARNIKAAVFEKAVHAFEKRHFTANFLVTHAILLRRQPGEKLYEKIGILSLNTNNPIITQAKLF